MTYQKILLKESYTKERANMVANIVSFLSRAISSSNVQKSTAVRTISNNPFSNPKANPFVLSQGNDNYSSYAKNNPVKGGYFAGYRNGKANIVGQRLFVEA